MSITTYPSSKRIAWIDNLRGIAILLMMIFHFCYDLRYFGWVNWNVPNGDGWWQFRYLILSLFIFTMGMSLFIAHQKKFNRKRFFIRLAQLGIASVLVTVMSLFMFPSTWIYFGILHFLFFASLIGILFLRHAFLAFGCGVIILIAYWFSLIPTHVPFSFFEHLLPNHTEDFVPFIPWLGVCLIGLAAGKQLPLKKIEDYAPNLPRFIGVMGRHGLIIYLIHQPIFFALLTPIALLSAS